MEAVGEPEGMGYCRLQLVPLVVGRTGQRFHPVEAAIRARHRGRRASRHLPKTAASERQLCKKCGGHLMTNHPGMGLVDVYAATLPKLKFAPGLHVNYAETVLPMRDGLPKFKDFPAEFGGSGELIKEQDQAA